jgi:chromosome segregation ATPase
VHSDVLHQSCKSEIFRTTENISIDNFTPVKLSFGNDMILSLITAHINRVKKQIEILTDQIKKAKLFFEQIKQKNLESVQNFIEEIKTLQDCIKLKKSEISNFSDQLQHYETWLSQVENALFYGENDKERTQQNTQDTKKKKNRVTKREKNQV